MVGGLGASLASRNTTVFAIWRIKRRITLELASGITIIKNGRVDDSRFGQWQMLSSVKLINSVGTARTQNTTQRYYVHGKLRIPSVGWRFSDDQ